jgi:hypothetical protein
MRREQFVIPNEKAVAADLLNQKLSGAHYFQVCLTWTGVHATEQAPPGDGERGSALPRQRSKLEESVKVREFDPERAAKLEKLIDRLAEPSSSAWWRGDH